MRVAVVYGRSPSGHAAAAVALEAGLRACGAECFRVSAAADINPLLGPLLDKLYIGILEHCPWFWRTVYDHPAIVAAAGVFRRLYWRLRASKVLNAIAQLEPDVLVCTHAAPLSVLALGRRFGLVRPKLVACPTDYDVHSFWLCPEVDLYLAPSAFAAGRLTASGAERARIVEAGIPIWEEFARPLAKTEARRGLGLPERGPVLLISGGSRGLGRLSQAAQAMLEEFPQSTVAVLCGENKRLWSALRSAPLRRPRLVPYLGADRTTIRRLMAAADLLIGKAGGVTLAESSAVGLPVVFWEILPGQEERNARFWLGAGAARQAHSLRELIRAVADLLGNPAEAARLRGNAAALGRPRAAWTGAQAVLAIGAESAGSESLTAAL